MSRLNIQGVLAGVLAPLCFFAVVFSASAAELSPYELNADLSLTGDCTTSKLDPVADPSCPYPAPPEGPSGRFEYPRSVAVDAYGNIYVAVYADGGEGSKGRIDIFDDEGRFITELADPDGPKSLAVDTKGNLYVYDDNGVVRYSPTVYEPKAGKIEYGEPPVPVRTASVNINGLAIDNSNDHLYVARGIAVEEYDSAAGENKLLSTIAHPQPGSWSTWVAVDSERRRLYASVCRDLEVSFFDCAVRVFEADAPHALLEEVDGSNTPAGKFESAKGWLSIAVDEETGDFFVDDLEVTDSIYQFNEDYELVSELELSAFQGGNALQIAVSNSPLNEDAVNRRVLFVPILPGGNRVLAFEPPGVLPPEITGAAVVNIGETEAEVWATIDPRGSDTEYVVEYVTQQAFEEEGFATGQVVGEGTIPGGSLPNQVSANIEGLTPGTGYRFRVVAENEAGDAEPVGEGAFVTYLDAPVAISCPNQPFRIGFSAVLPDCRAYELVTPPDTNGRPVRGASFAGDQFAREQSSPAGNVVSFLIEGGVLPGMEGVGGLEGDPYNATRTPSGWSTTSSGPSGTEATVIQPGAISSDQTHSFWRGRGEGSAVIPGKEGHFIRYPNGQSELIGRGSLGTDPGAVGKFITEGGTHIIFQTRNLNPEVAHQLEPNAPPTGTEVVYDRTADEVTHVISLLPGDVTPAAGEHAEYLGASADGNGIAFEIEDTLYLRKDNAVTYKIGEDVEFAGVSEGGERIFYVEAGDLLAFDTDSEEVIAFSTTGDVTPVNVAPQGTRAYFVSPSVLGGENPNGAVAQAGKENLYLSEEGGISFVGTVTTPDVEGEAGPSASHLSGLGLWTEFIHQPTRDPSRLNPSGTVLLFESRADLGGYDPGGTVQIYRYDSVSDRLHCISCIPTLVPAEGGASLATPTVIQSLRTDAPSSLFGFVPNLSLDGKRAFFESEEALVSYDTDGVQDVYEWEEAGVGSCIRPGGCVYLISSGRSAKDNYLFGHSDSGDDVFFTTSDVLTASDLGATISVYDARVGGGFPEQSEPPCAGEGCRPDLPPVPGVVAPGKAGPGAGNFAPPRKPRQCPKGKRKVKRHGKVRCIKKHRKQKHRKAGTRRGATR